jgi:hypothetical protein
VKDFYFKKFRAHLKSTSNCAHHCLRHLLSTKNSEVFCTECDDHKHTESCSDCTRFARLCESLNAPGKINEEESEVKIIHFCKCLRSVIIMVNLFL